MRVMIVVTCAALAMSFVAGCCCHGRKRAVVIRADHVTVIGRVPQRERTSTTATEEHTEKVIDSKPLLTPDARTPGRTRKPEERITVTETTKERVIERKPVVTE